MTGPIQITGGDLGQQYQILQASQSLIIHIREIIWRSLTIVYFHYEEDTTGETINHRGIFIDNTSSQINWGICIESNQDQNWIERS